jgi:hypothetical protein
MIPVPAFRFTPFLKIGGSRYKAKATDDVMVRKIPEEFPIESSLPDMQGTWIILQPIEADLQLVQSGHLVSGTYCSARVMGVIEGALFREGEDIIFIGKWADQLGRGDFRVSIHNRENAVVGRTFSHEKHQENRMG